MTWHPNILRLAGIVAALRSRVKHCASSIRSAKVAATRMEVDRHLDRALIETETMESLLGATTPEEEKNEQK